MRPITPETARKEVRHCYDFSNQVVIYKGEPVGYPRPRGSVVAVKFTCDNCGDTRWAERASVRHKQSPYCKPCAMKLLPRVTKELRPEQVPEKVRHCFDFSKQIRKKVGKKTPKMCRLIWFVCDQCGSGKYVRAKTAMAKVTPNCNKCRKIYTPFGKPRGKGWFIDPNGYKIVNASRFYPNELEYIQKHLLSHDRRNCNWFKEHRIVALLSYGPQAVRKGTVVRHIDGNKINNKPENLIAGTKKENNRDHAKAVMEMMKWRQLAISLALIISSNENLGIATKPH